jgi:hypothetical protein
VDVLLARLAENRSSDQFAGLFVEELEDIAACCGEYNCVEE